MCANIRVVLVGRHSLHCRATVPELVPTKMVPIQKRAMVQWVQWRPSVSQSVLQYELLGTIQGLVQVLPKDFGTVTSSGVHIITLRIISSGMCFYDTVPATTGQALTTITKHP